MFYVPPACYYLEQHAKNLLIQFARSLPSSGWQKSHNFAMTLNLHLSKSNMPENTYHLCFLLIFFFYLLQLGCNLVAVVMLRVYKTWNSLLLNLSREGTWEACSGNLESWEPTQHLLLDTGKPRKTCVEVAGRRTFRILTSSQQSGV